MNLIKDILFHKKNPGTLGFFSFGVYQFALIFLLQWISRTVFLLHRGAAGQMSAPDMAGTWWHGLPLDLSMTCYLFLPVWLYMFFCLLLRKTPQWSMTTGYLLLLTVCLVFLSAADAEMYRVWGSKFNRQALDYMRHPDEALASSSDAAWGILGFELVVIVWLYYRISGLKRPSPASLSVKTATLQVLILPLLVLGLRGGTGNVPISQSSAYFSPLQAANLAAVNSGWNFFYYVTNKSDKVNPEDYNHGVPADESLILFGKPSTAFTFTQTERPNVVVIVLESFTAGVSQRFGGKRNHTPFLDSLAATGLAFTRAYAQGDRTDKGLACVFSGWPGQPWQSILNEPDKAARLPSLAQVFGSRGYRTVFTYGGDLDFANMGAYLRNSGFQQVADLHSFSGSRESKWGMYDGTMFSSLSAILDTLQKPFFAGALTLSSHEPYDVPGPLQVQGSKPVHKFFNSIQYTDRELRRFFNSNQHKPWFSNTIFVLVADHGRDIGDPDMEYDHPGHFHIPIVVWGSPLLPQYKGMAVNRVVSQTGIAPFLCAIADSAAATRFSWSAGLLNPHVSSAIYFYTGGFGLVSDSTALVFHNEPAGVVFQRGNSKIADKLLRAGQAAQFRLIADYLRF
ncbi:MAG: sulfatase-like hydrolase/transferase [Bacteroidetes bacterium]|nr:sulfatase-like hydrolase/transferase [Bacteroidota bacterium]